MRRRFTAFFSDALTSFTNGSPQDPLVGADAPRRGKANRAATLSAVCILVVQGMVTGAFLNCEERAKEVTKVREDRCNGEPRQGAMSGAHGR
jgi:hypothetical protein